ncbi:dihydrofolate reductase family protein [Streptomyces fulvorobeus]|uniref:Dihydrofolate reductase n=1 Tax=Streptomyces fulvorobeus TaxID=284028 RepID=A0A7Y9HGX9_9ACTN|nr:dihydrofolate reductase family protein [Streptomyces fulvorobeus]NYE44344.1 dihydrofolate reductase [Streptomyces fulvorobeus]
MRKIVLAMSVSVDGFFEGPGRELDWHLVDDELHQHFNDELRSMSAFLDGRVSYELMAGYWPTADAAPGASGPMAEFAGIWREMPKLVFSRTLERAEWNTTIRREVVPEEIEALKRQPGGDMSLGGADLAATFMRHDLIDAYHLYVHPVLLGRGRPLFPDSASRTALVPAGSRTFGNGVVLLRYTRRPPADVVRNSPASGELIARD